MASIGKFVRNLVGQIINKVSVLVDDFETSVPKTEEDVISKFSYSHIKKVVRDDLRSLQKEGTKEFFLRWWRRKSDLVLLPPFFIKDFFVKRKLSRNKKIIMDVAIFQEGEIDIIPEKLSVVINTKNSPPFFKEILQKYRYQKGFKEIEIIIVDSGSTDNTLLLAKEFNCKIIEIKPEEFRHGRSRNIGLEAATGKYVISAVSDAIPATLDLAYKVAVKLEENKAAALSVKQIPRFDADLFAIWSIYQHSKFMFGSGLDDVWVENIRNFDSLNTQEKRKLALIDDVFVLHNSEQIKKQKYDNDTRFAEDLLLSISYIRKKIKIGFVSSEAVIHSHSRTPEYFLKRYFTDSNTIYNVLKSLPTSLSDRIFSETSDQDVLNNIASLVSLADGRELGFNNHSESWVGKYLNFLKSDFEINQNIKDIWISLYTETYLAFKDFLDQSTNTNQPHEDVKLRIAATTSASLLSEYLIQLRLRNRFTKKLSDFNDLMEQGI